MRLYHSPQNVTGPRSWKEPPQVANTDVVLSEHRELSRDLQKKCSVTEPET